MIADVPEEDDGVAVRRVVEHGLEVGRAGRQDHFVGLELDSVAGQGHVDKGLVVQEVLEDAQQVVLVVVPSQAVLLRQQRVATAVAGRVHLSRMNDGKGVGVWRMRGEGSAN